VSAERSRLPGWARSLVAAAAGLLIAVGLLAGVMTLSGSGHEYLARRAVVGVVALLAFVAPLLFACAGSLRDLGMLTAAVAGMGAALAFFSLALDPGAAGASVLAVAYVLACSLFAFGLSSALGRALSSRAAGRTVAVLILLAAVTTPFTTKRLYKGLEDSPGAQKAAIRLSVGCNPFIMANSALALHADGGGSYKPIQGAILYEVWIGTDFPFGYPTWWGLAVRWALLGFALWALSEWLPRRLSHVAAGVAPAPDAPISPGAADAPDAGALT